MKRIISVLIAAILIVSMLPVVSAEETAIIDESFENGTGLFGQRGTVQVVTSDKAAYSGKKSLLLDGRGGDAWNGPSANVTDKVKLDEVYYLRMYARAAKEGESFHVKFIFELSDDNGKTYPNVVNGLINNEEWTLIEGYWTADYSGTLSELNLCVESEENGIGKSFYIDDVFFAQADVVPSTPEQTVPEEKASAAKTDAYNNYIVPSGIADSGVETQFGLLTALGILNYGEEDTIDLTANLTRGEFMEYIYRMHSQGLTSQKAEQIFHDVPDTHKNAAAIAYAYHNGLVAGNGRGFFEPDELVTYQHASIILMTMLGYGPEQKQSAVVAKSAGLFDDISMGGIEQPLTYENLFKILYNGLHSTAIVQTVYSGNISVYGQNSNRTFLYEHYDIDYITNVVNANCYTSIDDGANTALEHIRVGEYTFRNGNTTPERLLGYKSTAYFKREDNVKEYELVYITPLKNKNTVFTLADEQIVDFKNSKYYYQLEDGTIKTKDVARNYVLVYNNKTIVSGEDFSIDKLKPDVGNVTLIANDGTDLYSIVIVEDYQTLVVSAIDKTEFIAFGKNNDKLPLDKEQNVSFIRLTDDSGKEIEMTSLKENDIISYLHSGDKTRPVIYGVRTRTKIKGTLDEKTVGTEKVYTVVSGKEYKVSPHFFDAGYTLPAIGENIVAYLDMFGQIAYIGDSSTQGIQSAYLVDAGPDGSMDKITEVKLFKPDGEFECLKLADKVSYKNGRYTDEAMLRELAIGGIGGRAKQQIILYTTNADGRINSIDIAHASEDAALQANDGNTFHRVVGTETKNTDGSNKFTFKNTIGVFFNVGYGFFAVDARTVIYCVPEPGSEDCYTDDAYSIVKVSSLNNNTNHTIDPFKVGYDDVVASYAVKYDATQAEISSREVFILTKQTNVIGSDGADTIAIRVFKDNAEQKLVLKSTEVWDKATEANGGKELKSGDIVRFETNTKGLITQLEKATVINSYDSEFAGMEGYIFRKKGNWAYFTQTPPDGSTKINGDMILIPLDKFAITIYSIEAKTAAAGTPADIRDYETTGGNCSKVYMTLNYENPISLIVLED